MDEIVRQTTASADLEHANIGLDFGLPEPCFLVDGELNFHVVNQATEQFFGRSRAVLCRSNLHELVGPTDQLADLLARSNAAPGSVRAFDVRVDRHGGGTCLASVSAAPTNQPGQQVVMLFETSNQPQSASSLVTEKAVEGWHHLISMLAHEVKNPLAGIRGAAQLLKTSVSEADEELASLIVEESDRLSSLVDQFDFLGETSSSNNGEVNIHEILTRVRSIAQNSFGQHVSFHQDFDPSLPLIVGDKDRLVQVILNLVKNACEAFDGVSSSATSPQVILRSRYIQGNTISLRNERRVQAPLTVEIIDNGPGVEPQIAEHIFDPFRTNKSEGSGLGLSLVSKILADHGAGVDFQSADGRTVFRMSFPYVQP